MVILVSRIENGYPSFLRPSYSDAISRASLSAASDQGDQSVIDDMAMFSVSEERIELSYLLQNCQPVLSVT
jgi:hypothetical protein